MAIAVVLVLLVLGSVLFHFLSPWYFTPIASNWSTIDDTMIAHLLGHRRRVRRRQPVHGVGVDATATAKGQQAHYEPENKKLEWWLLVVTDDRRRRHAGAGPVRLGASSSRCRRTHDRRGRRPAVALELSLAGQGRQARHRAMRASSATTTPSASIPTDPERPRRRAGREPGTAPARSASRSSCCCAPRTCCTTSRWRSSASRWIWCRAWSRYVWFTPTRTGNVRPAVRGTVRHRPLRDARPDRGRGARASRPGWPASRPSARRRRRATPAMPWPARPYAACAACHGATGEGNLALNAPKLAARAPGTWSGSCTLFKQGRAARTRRTSSAR